MLGQQFLTQMIQRCHNKVYHEICPQKAQEEPPKGRISLASISLREDCYTAIRPLGGNKSLLSQYQPGPKAWQTADRGTTQTSFECQRLSFPYILNVDL